MLTLHFVFSFLFCFLLCFQQPSAAALRGAIQLAVGFAVGNLSSKPDRDVLMQDFSVVESVFLPRCVCRHECEREGESLFYLLFFFQ